MMSRIEILDVKIDNLTINEVLQRIEKFMTDEGQHYIVTPNPEFLVLAQKDEKFQQILNQADLAVADGIGLIFASWFLGQPLKQRITGVDLMEKICQLATQRNWQVFLLGGQEGVAEKVAKNLKEKYFARYNWSSGTCFVWSSEAELRVNAELRSATPNSSPKILFVALGAPQQEKWIVENLKKMPSVKLAMGVGGAFDFISGRIPRAPKILQRGGLEWFWRLCCQPWRAKRIFNAVIVFPWLVLKQKIYG